jgi:lysophospholipase L1-like esterase
VLNAGISGARLLGDRIGVNAPARFDAVIDFDALARDPAHPARLKPDFDSGDHLHPGDRGNKAMADAVELDALFKR